MEWFVNYYKTRKISMCFLLTRRFIQEVSQQTPHDRLVGYNQDIALSLQLHNDRLQPGHQILVALASRVPVCEFIRIPRVKIGGVFLLYFCVCHLFAYAL